VTRRYRHARSKFLLETGHVVIYRYTKATRSILILGVFPSKAMTQRPSLETDDAEHRAL